MTDTGSYPVGEAAAEFANDDVEEIALESGDTIDDAGVDADDDVLVLEEVDNELVLPVWEPTGEPRVDAALDLLTALDPDDVHQHAAVFDDVHQRLRQTLSDVDGDRA